MAIDIWALGLIFYKMLVGRVAFPGVNQYILFQNITNRKINWPPEEEIDDFIDAEAKDLVERMLQTDPTERINIKEIKNHAYFKGVDFQKVSHEDYDEAKILVQSKLEEVRAERMKGGLLADISLQTSQHIASNMGIGDHMDGVSYLPVMDPSTIALKGYLLKDNWYGNKQKRYFELYPEGIIKYFEIKGRIRIYKGCLSIGSQTVLNMNMNQMRFSCDRKKREYLLVQPPQAKIGSFESQKQQGNCSIIEKWRESMQSIIDKKKAEAESSGFLGIDGLQRQQTRVNTQVKFKTATDSSGKNFFNKKK